MVLFKALAIGCSYNCRQLTYSSFQLMHITWWPHCSNYWSSSSEPWRPKRKLNIITVLTTLPQGWVAAC